MISERAETSRTVFLVNFRNHRDIYPPFGIMYVADALLQAGFQVRLFHEPEERVDDFVREVAETCPLFVGFSTITGPQLGATIQASRHVHDLGVPVVWGGVHATIMPFDVLREPYVDFVVVNEGEETVQDLARGLAEPGHTDWAAVPGLAFCDENGEAVFNGERPFIEDLDQFRPRWDLLNVEPYLINSGPYRRALPVYISRGCPFRCGFCYNAVVMKRTWRQHSNASVTEQVRWLREHYAIDAVDYADDYLFGRRVAMKKLVEEVGMPWSGQVRVQLLKPEFVEWMRETGCQWVNIGVESGSQRILDIMTKDQKAEQIEWGIQNLVDGAPHVEANLSFILGTPGESVEERTVTLRMIERLSNMSEKVRCATCVYMPYPGTPLWGKALQAGYKPPERQDGWCEFDLNRGNTPWMDDAEAQVMSDINRILFVGRSRGAWYLAPYYALLRWRWRHGYFRYYWEGALKRFLLRSPLAPLMQRFMRHAVVWNAQTHKGPDSNGTIPATPSHFAERA